MMFLGQVKLVIQKFDHLGSVVAVAVGFFAYIYSHVDSIILVQFCHLLFYC